MRRFLWIVLIGLALMAQPSGAWAQGGAPTRARA